MTSFTKEDINAVREATCFGHVHAKNLLKAWGSVEATIKNAYTPIPKQVKTMQADEVLFNVCEDFRVIVESLSDKEELTKEALLEAIDNIDYFYDYKLDVKAAEEDSVQIPDHITTSEEFISWIKGVKRTHISLSADNEITPDRLAYITKISRQAMGSINIEEKRKFLLDVADVTMNYTKEDKDET